MATSTDEIAEILQKASVHFEMLEEPGVFLTVWLRHEQPVSLLILVLEDGELVQLRVPGLVQTEERDKLPMLFRAALSMGYEMRLVQFEYDPTDGEFSVSIDVPLEDATLTAQQLLRSASILVEVSVLARRRLEAIIETGLDASS